MAERHEDLTEFVGERAGLGFRAALHYDEAGWDLLAVRPEFRSESLASALPDLYEEVTTEQALVTAEEYPPLGEAQATAEIHDDGVLLHFREGEGEGVVVTLDPEAGRDLVEFVERCNEILAGERSVEAGDD